MPRHLSAALQALAAWPLPQGPFGYSPEGAEQLAVNDFVSSQHWYDLGIDFPEDVRPDIVRLWKARPDLRRPLSCLVLCYPCPEFQRIYLRSARRAGDGHYGSWDDGHHGSWFTAYPWLKDHLHHDITRLARQWDKPWLASRACLIWARHMEGGAAAWRTLAGVVVREDVREAHWAAIHGFSSENLRHELVMDQRISRREAQYVDHFLENIPGARELGGPPIDPATDQPPPPDRHEPWRGRNLANVVHASRAFAGQAWNRLDEGYLAHVLANLPASARAQFPTNEALLARITELSQGT